MSSKTTSLDIQKGKGSMLDITHIFPTTVARPLDLARHGEIFSDMTVERDVSDAIDLSIDTILSISRFRTVETLDLAIPEVIDPNRWQR